MLYFRNAKILTPYLHFDTGTLLVDQDRIRQIQPVGQLEPPAGSQVIEAAGLWLVPGFIDLQCNGAFGFDFTAVPETIWPVAAALPRYGVTSFLPTIITSPPETIAAAQGVLNQGPPPGWRGAIPLGLHVEGPFLNPAKKGAHPPAHLRPPEPGAITNWSPDQGVRLVTLAPELPGALAIARTLVERGVVVSAGHSLATYEEAQAGFAAGISYGTHLFNAMPPLNHRAPGLAGALLANAAATVGLIADGIHLHPAMVKLIWTIKGGPSLTLVSDAMAALGMAAGRYQLADQTVTVTENEARLPDGTLAGAVLSLEAGLRNLIDFAQCSLAEALPAVTTTPANLLKLAHRRGQLSPGYPADLVLLTPALQVALTLVGGEILYRNEQILPNGS